MFIAYGPLDGVATCLVSHVRWMSSVRVRFAPSPTGYMHIGGLRTALVNKLFAVKQNGRFILRIEDTDKTRYHHGSYDDIMRSLQWATLLPDEGPAVGGDCGPYIQSERKDLYSEVANQLIKQGLAYRCFCSVERLEILRNEQRRQGESPRYDNRCRYLSETVVAQRLAQNQPHVVRFKVPHTKMPVHDLVFGTVNFDTQDSEGDFIILKSDHMPVYHLANVVDDHYMNITHVIRGAEWLSSTPKHLLLYDALKWTPPHFAHLPLLLSSSGGKLSKRSPEFAEIGHVRNLIAAGYVPSAVLTWLSSVGGTRSESKDENTPDIDEKLHLDSNGTFGSWSPNMQFEDLVSRFNFDNISRQSVKISADLLRICGRVHFEKLLADASIYCSSHSAHINYRSPALLTELRAYLTSALPGAKFNERPTVEDDVRMIRQLQSLSGRVSCYSDLTDPILGFSSIWQPVNPSVCLQQFEKVWSAASPDKVLRFLSLSEEKIQELDTNAEESGLARKLKNCLKQCSHDAGVQHATAMHLLRVCLMGQEIGPPVVDLIVLLSPKTAAERIGNIRNYLRLSAVPAHSVTHS
ncbi:unnamed protein product [Calicophoron daubneyi]|uniref:Nondiscriminating glutamyl-tRNA synthetase EARS2, mitochondrial n=1 Tax=Calicophoron daubneyi TaxID=300641 RepID=A0AAV2T7P2_CALDB